MLESASLTASNSGNNIEGTVKKEKTKVLVVFEDGREVLESMAKEVKACLGANATVKTRSATEVAVAEILAADAYAFGVDDADALAWTEIRRLFTGMNLAGRKALFFTGKAGGADPLRKAFEPAELAMAGPVRIAAKDNGNGAWASVLVNAP
jgi:hypothetical protein